MLSVYDHLSPGHFFICCPIWLTHVYYDKLNKPPSYRVRIFLMNDVVMWINKLFFNRCWLLRIITYVREIRGTVTTTPPSPNQPQIIVINSFSWSYQQRFRLLSNWEVTYSRRYCSFHLTVSVMLTLQLSRYWSEMEWDQCCELECTCM